MKLHSVLTFFHLVLVTGTGAYAQKTATAEDSLDTKANKGQSTFLGGYGDISYVRNFNEQTSLMNLNRAVLFVGHKFSDRISLFTEFELEDAKIAGGDPGGEFALEQAYLKFILTRNLYVSAGLIIPRIGMINENHLPADFNGVQRPVVERYVIPATWREIGIGLNGHLNRIPLHFSLAVLNGLNGSGFEHGTGIREGRFEGRDATANNMAVTASLLYSWSQFKIQVSGYAGGSVGESPRMADSLKLQSGIFGTPVLLGEINVQYRTGGLAFKALGSMVSIPDAFELNRAYAGNTPEFEYGCYAEVAYDLLHDCKKSNEHQCWLFARYEKFDLNARIPSNGIMDETLKQDHLIAGISYLPLSNIVIKADVRILRTGKENNALIINPDPGQPAYRQHNSFLNIGVGYAF